MYHSLIISNRRLTALGALAFLLLSLLFSQRSYAHTPPAKTRIAITEPSDGAVVPSTFRVKFLLQGFKVIPAGTTGRERHKGGHHHLLIDTPLPDLDLDEVIPMNEHILHYNAAETETILTLPPGKHTLQLLLGDEAHEAFEPPLYSAPITIQVR